MLLEAKAGPGGQDQKQVSRPGCSDELGSAEMAMEDRGVSAPHHWGRQSWKKSHYPTSQPPWNSLLPQKHAKERESGGRPSPQ